VSDVRSYLLWEHATQQLCRPAFPPDFVLRSKRFGDRKDAYCFSISGDGEENYRLSIGYYVGVDWLAEGHSAVIVAPKLDTRATAMFVDADSKVELDEGVNKNSLPPGDIVSVDYFAILRQCIQNDFLYREIDQLVQIDWKAKPIPIIQEQDWLSPLLIVKFLKLLHAIVQKGLKKSYYTVTANLESRIKGKILVGANIRQNVVKNKFTKTVCQYQEFGIDHFENRLLKKAFRFSLAYIDNNRAVFGDENTAYYRNLIAYCGPAFELVSDDVSTTDVRHYKPNPFFREYKDGLELAKLILKRFAYTISNTSSQEVTTPPYWIDMPRLFELYCYKILSDRFPEKGEIRYHFSTYGNELDFLLKSGDVKMVIDAKYKPLYKLGKDHRDMRQLSGYSRLTKVRKELGVADKQIIDCVIIYPNIEDGYSADDFPKLDFNQLEPIGAYERMFKIGVKIPCK
jgi:5-methylcytosine-specific restriction enzyme subunit McrC